MNNFELQITKGSISTNLDTLKQELEEIAKNYEGVVVSEDTIPIAKKDLASLRALVKEVEDRRKAVKKEWNQPYADFEAEVKNALAIINKPIDLINEQLKEFESQRKADKEQHVREIYAENIREYEEYLPFSEIFDEKWLNVSTTDKDIIFDINAKLTQVKIDLEAIKALQSEFEDEVIKAYKESGNQLSTAIQRNTQLITAKQMATEKAKEEVRNEVIAEIKEEVKEEVKAEIAKEEPKTDAIAIFTVRPKDKDQEQQIRQFLEFSEIQYSAIY